MLSTDYNEKYDFKGKKVEELSLKELSILQGLLEMLPEGVTYTITRTDTKQQFDYIDTFIEDMNEAFFDVPDKDIEKLVGTCFINDAKDEVVKIVGMSDEAYKFLYEKYEKWSDGEWHCENYNWLQDSVYGQFPDEKLKKYCLTPQTNMNIASESMFQVGRDGNLYIDVTCGFDYEIYKPMKLSTFELIKNNALENDSHE